MNFDLVVNLPTTNCLIYIDKFRSPLKRRALTVTKGKPVVPSIGRVTNAPCRHSGQILRAGSPESDHTRKKILMPSECFTSQNGALTQPRNIHF